jgi:alkanesulfonate monooxygenase SsuD/methylene tetrahydromethanopterin reductase-like flavin-dependent oxidoreductase (luciferase family)
VEVEDLDSKLGEVLERRRPRHEDWPTGLFENVWRFAQANELATLRDFILGAGASHRQLVGSPEQIADDFEKWFTERGADGFNLSFSRFPDQLEVFVDHVVPELRRRGLFRHEYSGPTFRDHLGLAVTPNPHSAHP